MTQKISIVIPTYQHARTLPSCLDSVFTQDYGNTEVIVVDDGSTDNTTEVLSVYADRVKIIPQANSGANPARNAGLAVATGEYVIFVDADVIMQPTMLTKLAHALDVHHDASYAYCGFRFGWKHFRGVPWNADKLRRMNFVHTSALVRRADFPGFDNAIRRFQDWDVWLTMLEAGKHGVLVPETLFRCIIDGASRVGSAWLPSFMYILPWRLLPWKPARVAKYEAAKRIIQRKHDI